MHYVGVGWVMQGWGGVECGFIFSLFTFNLLQMTQTQEIITHTGLKIHKWIWQDVYEWGNVS